MMAAVLAQGTTMLHNPAQEPEIVDLAGFLKRMGARIRGEGTDCIEITGVASLQGCDYEVIPDRIEAATLLATAAITHGSISLRHARLADLGIVAEKFKEHGLELVETGRGLKASMGRKKNPVHITTQPHPGFPTDMQAQWMALMTVTPGSCRIEEDIFENRFLHAQELLRMSARIETRGPRATVEGGARLSGCPLMVSDLRAGAALVLAGLAARGTTKVLRVYHLDRGYERLEKKLRALGAAIRRVPQ
jgi:UDP-N-acetylglucosamine 1-carboxyvinyltransferase